VSSNLKAVRDAKTILLTTYKRDGTPVETPVSIAFEGDRAFFRMSFGPIMSSQAG
jgi:hypothetical protein